MRHLDFILFFSNSYAILFFGTKIFQYKKIILSSALIGLKYCIVGAIRPSYLDRCETKIFPSIERTFPNTGKLFFKVKRIFVKNSTRNLSTFLFDAQNFFHCSVQIFIARLNNQCQFFLILIA